MDDKARKKLVSAEELNDLDRLVMAWVNGFPDIPDNIMAIKYEFFASKTVGIAISTVQGSYITAKYITGGYKAEYNFEVHYQIEPSGASDNKRLSAVELLNAFGAWAEVNWPDIGESRRVIGLETTGRAGYLGATSDYYEDYMIPLKLTYEVNV